MEKYVLGKKLGGGGFGEVYLAKRKDNGQKVAIKIMKKMSSLHDSERRAAENEVLILSSLDHPNIVTYVESFYVEGRFHIVMELCDRGDLAQIIEEQVEQGRGHFREHIVLDWFVQICIAVKHLHGRNIVHRDIKPLNAFVIHDGSVKIGDFGI